MDFAVADPHFHFWNVTKVPHNTLGKLGEELPVVVASDYRKDAEGLRIASVVHVETVCAHPAEGWRYDEVAETRNALDEAAGLGVPCHVVAYVDIQSPDAAAVIAAHRAVAGAALVGVRSILNYDAADASITWPNITRGDYLRGAVPEFNRGVELVADEGLVLDVHLNAAQMRDAAAFCAAHPRVTVVINHLGCLRLPREDAPEATGESAAAQALLAEWRAGMLALAALPSVYMKLSGLDFVTPHWVAHPAAAAVVRGMVRETVAAFGPARCMVASNWPVAKMFTAAPTGQAAGEPVRLAQLYEAIHSLVSDLPRPDREALFRGTAERVYRLPAHRGHVGGPLPRSAFAPDDVA